MDPLPSPTRETQTLRSDEKAYQVQSIEASFPPTRESKLEEQPHHRLAQLIPARKNTLLLVFAVAQFIDVCSVSGVSISVAQISGDIRLELSQIIWIITSYSLCFAAFLLFAGRLSDLFPAEIVFAGGFFMLGVFNLVTSFVTHSKYGFLILRGLGGISGAMTLPSAYHLAVNMFPDPVEQQQKLSLLTLAGATGNSLGLVLAGLCTLAGWPWFFRLLGIICLSFSAVTILLLPFNDLVHKEDGPTDSRWKRLDIVGVFIMTGALICFNLGLTQGPIDGWKSPSFIAPFVIAFILAPMFFLWESRIPPKSAVLPSTIWATTNIKISSIVILIPYAYFATSQIEFATYWQEQLDWKLIHVATAMLPQGVIGFCVGGAGQFFPQIIAKSRYSVGIGGLLIIIAEVLQVFSQGGGGMNYWKFCFPAYALGSAGAIISFFGSAITLISLCPPEISGVASAWTQVVAQVGSSLALAVQAGLQGRSLSTWQNSGARGFWFMLAFTALCCGQYVVLFRQPQSAEIEHEMARERVRKSASRRTSRSEDC